MCNNGCPGSQKCNAGKCVADTEPETPTQTGGDPEPTTTSEPLKPEEPKPKPGDQCNYGTPGFMLCKPHHGALTLECFNTLNDNRHCGRCENTCRPGENCVNGACAPPGGCGAQTYCPGSANGPCVNLDNDNTNCGACGRFCKPGQNCWGGKCK